MNRYTRKTAKTKLPSLHWSLLPIIDTSLTTMCRDNAQLLWWFKMAQNSKNL